MRELDDAFFNGLFDTTGLLEGVKRIPCGFTPKTSAALGREVVVIVALFKDLWLP